MTVVSIANHHHHPLRVILCWQ